MGKRRALKEKLRHFKNLVSHDYPIRMMIFFGSRAKGKPKKYSDVDLIIISPKFKNLDFVERGARMYDYWNIGYPVDFLCYTPKEFNKLKKQATIIKEAVRTGLEIK